MINKNKMLSIDNLKLKIEKYVSLQDNIAVVYLFGSAATGKMRRTSDLDIAIMSTRQIDGFERITMETELSNFIHMNFDIVEDITEIEMIAKTSRIREFDRLKEFYGFGSWKKMKGVARKRLLSGNSICFWRE